MRTKRFHIGDVLSITTGKLLSKNLMDGLYEILDWMSGQDSFTHEFPDLANKYRPILLNMYPELKNVDVSNITPDNFYRRMEKIEKEYGEYFDVPQIGEGRTEDPISSFVRIKEGFSNENR